MIFVMTATGRVGGLTLDALLRQGVLPSQLIAGARNPQKASGMPAGVEVRKADYTDREGMAAAFRGVETLILIPTITPPGPRCVEHNNALEAAREAGVKRVVFLSIQAAMPESRFAVAAFILFAECATRLSGMEWTLARMSLYIDPVAEWVPELKKMGRLPYPLVNGKIAYITRADVARALAAIARDPKLAGSIVELTGPESLSMPELAQAVSAAAGTEIPFATITEAEYRELCRQDHLPEEVTEMLTSLYRAVEAMEFSHVASDIEKLTGTPPERAADAIARLLGRA